MAEAATDRLLPLAVVADRTSLSKATIYRMLKTGQFPRPLQVGPNSVRWLESDLKSWMEALTAE